MTAFLNQKYDLQDKIASLSLYKDFRITQLWNRRQESPQTPEEAPNLSVLKDLCFPGR